MNMNMNITKKRTTTILYSSLKCKLLCILLQYLFFIIYSYIYDIHIYNLIFNYLLIKYIL